MIEASVWGASWGQAWGNSWGDLSAPVARLADTHDGGWSPDEARKRAHRAEAARRLADWKRRQAARRLTDDLEAAYRSVVLGEIDAPEQWPLDSVTPPITGPDLSSVLTALAARPRGAPANDEDDIEVLLLAAI